MHAVAHDFGLGDCRGRIVDDFGDLVDELVRWDLGDRFTARGLVGLGRDILRHAGRPPLIIRFHRASVLVGQLRARVQRNVLRIVLEAHLAFAEPDLVSWLTVAGDLQIVRRLLVPLGRALNY